MDVQTQTSPPVESSNSPVNPTTPTLVYVPVDYCVTRPFGRKLLEGNDECTKFYTGVTSWSIFKHLVTFLSTLCPSLVSIQSKLSPFDSVLLTLDCSEIFIERPCSYQARAQTYSNYKKHNTVKFLVGITPCGAVSYLLKCWGGRATDKCITMNSDFIRLLENGDVVLADRGFDIADDIAVHGASLIIPSFTRGKKQLSLQEVECSQRYSILQGTLPVTFLKWKVKA